MSQSSTWWVAPAPSIRTSTLRPGRRPVWWRGLTHRLAALGDVVGGGVAAGIARPEQDRERLAGAGGPVVGERPQRVVCEPALERRPGLVLLTM